MERMGATASSEAMRMPISQIKAVSRRDHVGSPLAFPWPKIYRDHTENMIIYCHQSETNYFCYTTT